MTVFTIGFTKKSAERFFTLLSRSNVKRLVDVRLHNVSQLSGFAKRDDLKYFLRELCNVEYQHTPDLAPDDGLLKSYKRKEISWDLYAGRFMDLMERRHIEQKYSKSDLDSACMLCSEDKPHFCHRRLVAEYLNEKWDSALEVRHLV